MGTVRGTGHLYCVIFLEFAPLHRAQAPVTSVSDGHGLLDVENVVFDPAHLQILSRCIMHN